MPDVPDAERRVDVHDAIDWCYECSRGWSDDRGLATSPPDAEEVGMSPSAWKAWMCLHVIPTCVAAAHDGPLVFVVTDRRSEGQWLDKAALLVARVGRPLTLHRILLRRDAGAVDIRRPTYRHLLCFGGRPGERTPDVIPDGPPLWRNGLGVNGARAVAHWMAQQDITELLNPFCGTGILLAAANEVGLHAYGCDLDGERVAEARTLEMPAVQMELA